MLAGICARGADKWPSQQNSPPSPRLGRPSGQPRHQ